MRNDINQIKDSSKTGITAAEKLIKLLRPIASVITITCEEDTVQCTVSIFASLKAKLLKDFLKLH